MSTVYVRHLRHGNMGTYHVSLLVQGSKSSFREMENVHGNIVRCALGKDVDYLLTATDERFPVTAADLADFDKYRD